MLFTLYHFGLKDNINSLNTNIRSYDFKAFNYFNAPMHNPENEEVMAIEKILLKPI